MIVIKAPNPIPDVTYPTLFTAGSIEMGKAEPWQDELAEALSGVPVTILNPRRDNWGSLEQDALHEQIEWELDGIERADTVAFYFDPETKSPITLLELGLVLASKAGRAIVCCPPSYWRYDNVLITCQRYHVPVIRSKAVFIETVRRRCERSAG